MEIYNKHDVLTTEALYNRVKRWGSNGVDLGALFEDGIRCRECGGNHFQSRGSVPGSAGKKWRLLCKDCGSWNTVPTKKMTK